MLGKKVQKKEKNNLTRLRDSKPPLGSETSFLVKHLNRSATATGDLNDVNIKRCGMLLHVRHMRVWYAVACAAHARMARLAVG